MARDSPEFGQDALRLVLSSHEQILSLQRQVEFARSDLTLSSADVVKVEIAAVLEASFLRQMRDALTSPMVRALVRTGIWSSQDLMGFLLGSANTGNAAVIMADCCDLVPAHCLSRLLDFLVAEKQQDSAAYSVKRFVPACLDAECHDLAVVATNWYAQQFELHVQGSELDWVLLTIRLYEEAGRPVSDQKLLATMQSSQVLDLFEAWIRRAVGGARAPDSDSNLSNNEGAAYDGASLMVQILNGDVTERKDPVFDWIWRFGNSGDLTRGTLAGKHTNNIIAVVQEGVAQPAVVLNYPNAAPAIETSADAMSGTSAINDIDAAIGHAMSLDQYGVWRFDYVHGNLRNRAGALSNLCESLDGPTLRDALTRFLSCRWTQREGYEYVSLLRNKGISTPDLVALAFDASAYSTAHGIVDLLSLVSSDEALSRLASGGMTDTSSAVSYFAQHASLDGWSTSDFERLEHLIVEYGDAQAKAGYALRRRMAERERIWAGHVLSYLRVAVSVHGVLIASQELLENAIAGLSEQQIENLMDGFDSIPLDAQGELIAVLAESERLGVRLTELVRRKVLTRVAMPVPFRYQRWGAQAVDWITAEISLLGDLGEADFVELLRTIKRYPVSASKSSFLDLVANRIAHANSRLEMLSAAYELPGVMEDMDPELTLKAALEEGVVGRGRKFVDALCARLDLAATERLIEVEKKRIRGQSSRRRREWDYCTALKSRWAVLMVESGQSARMFETLESEWTGSAYSFRESGYAMDVMAEIATVLEMNDVERFLDLYKRAYGSYRIVHSPGALVRLIARATGNGIDYKTALGWMDFIMESQKAEVIRWIVQTMKAPVIGAAWRALLTITPDFSQMANREFGNLSAGELARLAPQLETVDAQTWNGLWRETIDRLMEFDHLSASLILLGLAGGIHDRYGIDVLRYMCQKMGEYRKAS